MRLVRLDENPKPFTAKNAEDEKNALGAKQGLVIGGCAMMTFHDSGHHHGSAAAL